MNNQQGGIISKLLFIPIAVACMAGFFFLGYYVGKRQGRLSQAEVVVPLPEVVSQPVPTTNDFTFFKTLSDKENKTVSIDLKPKPGSDALQPKEKPRPSQAGTQTASSATEKQQTVKKEPSSAHAPSGKVRYTLQTASYPQKSFADRDVKAMKQHGYAAFIVASDLPGKGTWYRVRLGSFANRNAAEKLQKELRSKEGINAYVLIE